jgi:hypothetical protein
VRLLSLPASVRHRLDEGELSAGHARALLAATDPAALAEEVVRRGHREYGSAVFLSYFCWLAATAAAEPTIRVASLRYGTLSWQLDVIAKIAELGDLSRFANPRQLMAYLGLVPSEYSSGASIKRGGLIAAARQSFSGPACRDQDRAACAHKGSNEGLWRDKASAIRNARNCKRLDPASPNSSKPARSSRNPAMTSPRWMTSTP